MKVIKKDYKELLKMVKEENAEGLVILGCAKPHKDWVNKLTTYLSEKDCFKNHETNPDKVWKAIYLAETTGGRYDLIFKFKKESNPISIGNMAVERLKMGSNSWLSDYVVNYADHHDYNEDVTI